MFNAGYKPPLISRIEYPDSGRRDGWQLRIRRSKKKEEPTFSDADYDGDPLKSLRAAEERRDTVLVNFPVMRFWEKAKTIRGNNSSGTTGVCWGETKTKGRKASKHFYTYFRAQARIDSILIGRRYRSWVVPLDDFEAKEDIKTLAVAQRLEWDAELKRAEQKDG